MGQQGLRGLGVGFGGFGHQAHHDARAAEAALAGATGGKSLRPAGLHLGRETLHRGDLPAGQAAERGDTRHAGLAVHQHGATAALALGCAAVLHGKDSELLTQELQQRGVGRVSGNRYPVDAEIEDAEIGIKIHAHRQGAGADRLS